MDEGRTHGTSRSLLEAFANALLERALPRIRQWLAQRLGPNAELRALELEGSRVHLVDARLPLGERAVLSITRATFATHPEELALGRAPVRLERLEGQLTISSVAPPRDGIPTPAQDDADSAQIRCRATVTPLRSSTTHEGDARSETGPLRAEGPDRITGDRARERGPRAAKRAPSQQSALHAEVVFEGAEGASGDAWVEGGLALRALTLADARFAGSARVTVTSERFAIDDAIVTSLEDGARIELGAGGTLGAGSYRVEHARLEARGITAGLLMELARLVRGVDLPSLPIGEDARASVIAALERDGALHALAVIEGHGARAELRGEGRVDRDGLSGEARGVLEPGLLTLRSLRMRGEPLALTATLSGTRAEPVVRFEAASPRVEPIAGLCLSRVRASWVIDGGVTLEARARTERGAIVLGRSRDGELSAKLERVPLAGLRSTPSARWLAALAEEGELFAELSGTSEALEGSIHVATPQASVTLAPMRAALGLRRIELEGTMRAAVRGEALASLLGVGLSGALELEAELERCLVRGALEALEARGIARASALALRWPGRGELAIRDASAALALERGVLHVEDVHARVLGGRVRARGFVRARQAVVTELTLEAVRGLGRWIAALPIAEDEVVDGALRRTDGALRGAITARTARSAIEGQLVIADSGALAGSRLSGKLAVADLAPLVREWSVRPDEAGVWSLEGAIEGSLLGPVFVLEGRSEAQPLWLVTRTESLRLEGRDARARARIDGARIAWSELALSLYGGTLRSRGGYARGVLGARVELEGVDAAALPLPRGTLGAHLGGRLGATLDVLRGMDTDAIACGRVAVEAPVYRVLERAAQLLSRLELPIPDPRGTAPLGARLELGPAGWRVSELDARLAELSVVGSGTIDREGGLRGRLVVRPLASWLRASAYLAPMSELVAEVPVRASGSIGAPRLEASALSTLEAVLDRSPIGELVQALWGDEPPAPPPRDPIRMLSIDALLDRLASQPDEPLPLAELLGRGLDVEDIAARVRRR